MNIQEDKPYQCVICNGSWKRKSQYMKHLGTKKHQKNIGVLKENDDMVKNDKKFEIYEKMMNHLIFENSRLVNHLNTLEKKIKDLEEKVLTVQTFNTQVQVNNNLNVVAYNISLKAFGNENWNYLSNNVILPLMRQVNSAIPEIVKKLHFSTDHPENHNIKLSNKKMNQLSIFDGKTWLTRDKNCTIESLVSNIVHKLESNYEFDFLNSSSPHVKQLWTELRDKRNEKQQKQIKTEVEYVLYDNRKMISIMQ
tara:strand:+ start:11479 stop:12234 length:756 start_codon:yes stop_codon:yes gene_type:complete